MDLSKEKKDALMEKIAKLLTLADGKASEKESIAARDMASKLMAKYRIAEAEVYRGDPGKTIIVDDEGIEVSDNGHLQHWAGQIAAEISRTFDTKVYYEGQSLYFLGVESDVETCIYFTEIILYYINREALKAWPNPRNWRKRNEFGEGARQSITSRLRKLKKQMDEEIQASVDSRDLMVVKNSTLDSVYADFVKDNNMKKSKRNSTKVTDSKNFFNGVAAGQKVPLSKGVNNDNTQRIN